MTEPNPSNHWESLISSLGATPPDEEEALQQPGPKEPSPPAVKPVAKERPPEPPADWDNIAGELGIEVPPQLDTPPQLETPPQFEAPLPKKDPLADLFTVPETPYEPTRQVTVTAESGDESPNFYDEKFDFEEPFDLLESGKPTAEKPEPEESDEEPAEKRPRKRRRRRRPAKGDKSEQTAEPVVESEDADIDEEQSSEKRRSKRRRPKRGKKSRSSEEQRDPDQHDEPRDEEPDEDDELDFRTEDEKKGRRDDRSVRAGFRGIPTWSEAVGLIIDKNMEGRASRPTGQQRGRGKKRRS